MTCHLRNTPLTLLAVTMLAAYGLAVHADQNAFTETFDTGNANWGDYTDMAYVTYVPSGGVGDSGYVTTERNFEEIESGTSVTFRAEDEFNSSGGAFEGNWLDLGYTDLTFYVRHNAPAPVSFSTRVSGPGNFPGATAVNFGPPVPPNVWTELSFDFSPDSPQIVTYEGSDHATVFSNVGHVQVSVSVPDGFETDTTAYTFDLDGVSAVVPEPSSLAVAALLGWGLISMRRRR